MQIKNQEINLINSFNFDFYAGSELESLFDLEQPCFSNCCLRVVADVDSNDDNLMITLKSYAIDHAFGASLVVNVDPELEIKIEKIMSDEFQSHFKMYCEKMADEAASNRFEGSKYD